MRSRDLIGYGGSWPNLTWPIGAKLAVSVVANFEKGAEQQVLDGDPVNERIGEVISAVPEVRPDPGQAQTFAYSRLAWRMANALCRFRVPATLFSCGRAAERIARVLRMLVEDGHETACHGWLWRAHAKYDSAEAILQTTGERPRYFFCRGAESPWTWGLLTERGYLYTCNGFDDDLPYRDRSGLIVVPYGLDANDTKIFCPNGFVRAADMIDHVTDALDVLAAEAARGLPRVLNVGFHLRISGRSGRFKAFEQVLAELDRERDRLWRARRIDIAQAFDAASPG